MIRLPTLARVEKVLGEPANEWAGRCYEIACACVKAKLVPGVAVYGHFLGKVSPDSFFGKRANLPFIQHGWVLMPDGRIWDPTRWSFEGPTPYIHVGENQGEYDEGGNQMRKDTMKPPPAWDPDERQFTFTSRELPTKPFTHVEGLLKPDYTEQEPGTFCQVQLFWLANLPYNALQPHAAAIYGALKAHDLDGFIPIDNLRRSERESTRSA